jgi:hypothetical protein
LSPETAGDLIAPYDANAEAASPRIAARSLDRIEAYVRGFEFTAQGGTQRDDIWPGLRTACFLRAQSGVNGAPWVFSGAAGQASGVT